MSIDQIGKKIGEARSARNRGDKRNARRLAESAVEMINKIELSFDNMDWRLLAQGDAHELMDDLDAAEKSYRQAIAATPGSTGSYIRLAELLEKQDRTSDLQKHLDDSIPKFPEQTAWHKTRAQLHNKAGRKNEAVGDYAKYLDKNSGDTAAMDEAGQVLQDLGKFDEASLYHAAALQIESGRAHHALQLARAMEGSGKTEAAEELYHAILQAQPYQEDAWLGLGLLAYRDQKFPEAEEFYRKAIMQGLKSAAIYHNLGDALSGQSKKAEALAEYQKASALTPQDAQLMFKISNLQQTGL